MLHFRQVVEEHVRVGRIMGDKILVVRLSRVKALEGHDGRDDRAFEDLRRVELLNVRGGDLPLLLVGVEDCGSVLRPVVGSQSTIPRAQRGSRFRFAGNEAPPMIQMASPSQSNQTGDSRGPSSELWARWAYKGRDRNSANSKMSQFPAETFCSTIFILKCSIGRAAIY